MPSRTTRRHRGDQTTNHAATAAEGAQTVPTTDPAASETTETATEATETAPAGPETETAATEASETTDTAPEAPETSATDAEPDPSGQTDPEATPGDPDTFPRAYVQRLRTENADLRTRARRSDDLGQRLHTAMVLATGRLADAEDLPYDDAHLDDPAALTAAIDELLTRKPHLASRRPRGSVGQGATGSDTPIDLHAMLRANA